MRPLGRDTTINQETHEIHVTAEAIWASLLVSVDDGLAGGVSSGSDGRRS
jgi:hypothetical protein